MINDDAYVVLGAIVSAHGIKGQFKVKPFTSLPMSIAEYGQVRLENGKMIELIAKSTAKGLVLCSSPAISTREQAEALKGLQFSVERDKLPPPDENEMYHADILGLEVVDTADKHLGVVVGVHDFGAGELLEVKAKGEKGTEFLPFYAPFVEQIDTLSGRIIMKHED